MNIACKLIPELYGFRGSSTTPPHSIQDSTVNVYHLYHFVCFQSLQSVSRHVSGIRFAALNINTIGASWKPNIEAHQEKVPFSLDARARFTQRRSMSVFSFDAFNWNHLKKRNFIMLFASKTTTITAQRKCVYLFFNAQIDTHSSTSQLV